MCWVTSDWVHGWCLACGGWNKCICILTGLVRLDLWVGSGWWWWRCGGDWWCVKCEMEKYTSFVDQGLSKSTCMSMHLFHPSNAMHHPCTAQLACCPRPQSNPTQHIREWTTWCCCLLSSDFTNRLYIFQFACVTSFGIFHGCWSFKCFFHFQFPPAMALKVQGCQLLHPCPISFRCCPLLLPMKLFSQKIRSETWRPKFKSKIFPTKRSPLK